jgi:hypothetical protein
MPTKTKKLPKKNTVKLTHSRNPILRHLRLVNGKHTGKLIHHRHTSHLALVIIMIFVGIFLFINQSFVEAQQVVSSGSVSVGAIVAGSPPLVGAIILSPTDGSDFTDTTITVSGSCSAETLVVVFDNIQSVGSTICTSKAIFSLIIQLQVGGNALRAMNYDSINQAGPGTAIVTINVKSLQSLTPEQVEPSNPESLQTPITPVVADSVPVSELENPAIIPGLSSQKKTCDIYDGKINNSIGGLLNVSVACVVRGLQPSESSAIGVVIYGGEPPYAINANLNDNQIQNVLISVPNPGYQTIPIKYNDPGRYIVKIEVKDKVGNTAITQTVVEINGIVGLNTFGSIDNTLKNTQWLQTPAPIYLIVLALIVGFWVGDIFDRKFGISKSYKKRRKVA